MLSLRGTVIALVGSVAGVLLLAGVTAGVFARPAPDPPVSMEQEPLGQETTPSAPVLPAQPPAPEAPPMHVAPAAPPIEDQRPAPTDRPVVAAPTKPAYQKPVTRPVSYREPLQRQPRPAPQQPPPPVQRPEPVVRPPASQSPAPSTKSRTVNTEPCNCDGQMRRVPTHWEPPRG